MSGSGSAHGPLFLHSFEREGGSRGLWLHGWMGSGKEGGELAEALGSTLVCPDMPGHGQTPLGDWHLRELLQEIASLSQEADWAGGYSMGGRILMMAAKMYPECFGPLVLESSFWGYTTPEERHSRLQTDLLRAEELKRVGLDVFTDQWYQLPMWGGFVPPSRTGDSGELAEALLRFSSGKQPDLQSWLQTTTSPVLWLAGTRDSAYVHRADWVRSHTRHRVVTLDTGHQLHGEQPAAWAGAVRDFLKTPLHQQE